jgi:hypothetical protein
MLTCFASPDSTPDFRLKRSHVRPPGENHFFGNPGGFLCASLNAAPMRFLYFGVRGSHIEMVVFNASMAKKRQRKMGISVTTKVRGVTQKRWRNVICQSEATTSVKMLLIHAI